MKTLAKMGFRVQMALLGVGVLMLAYGLAQRELTISSGGCVAIAFTYLSQRRLDSTPPTPSAIASPRNRDSSQRFRSPSSNVDKSTKREMSRKRAYLSMR